MSKRGEAAPTPVRETETATAERPRHAPMYRVLVHNDDVTPMDFVVHVLKTVFHKATPEAVEIMWRAHTRKLAHVATLALEQAEFRVDQAHSVSRAQKLPLTFTYEPEA